MKAQPLSAEEQRSSGFSHLIEIFFSDLIGIAALTGSLQLVPRVGFLTPGSLVRGVAGKIVTPFAGTTTLVADIGSGGTDAAASTFVAAKSLLAVDWFSSVNTTPQLFTAADQFIVLKFTATVQNLTALTAGRLQVFLSVVDLNTISRP